MYSIYMSKTGQKIYICNKCDAQFSKWNGRCFECGGWGTLKENVLDSREEAKKKVEALAVDIISLEKIEASLSKG